MVICGLNLGQGNLELAEFADLPAEGEVKHGLLIFSTCSLLFDHLQIVEEYPLRLTRIRKSKRALTQLPPIFAFPVSRIHVWKEGKAELITIHMQFPGF